MASRLFFSLRTQPVPGRAAPGHPPVWALIACAWMATLLGCGDSDVVDNWDPRALYLSDDSQYQVSAVRNPSPPQTGTNALELTVVDITEQPATGLSIRIEPWMPAHGHGTTVLDAKEVGPGQYVTEKLYFNMPGRWEIRLRIEGPGVEADRVVLDFDVR